MMIRIQIVILFNVKHYSVPARIELLRKRNLTVRFQLAAPAPGPEDLTVEITQNTHRSSSLVGATQQYSLPAGSRSARR